MQPHEQIGSKDRGCMSRGASLQRPRRRAMASVRAGRQAAGSKAPSESAYAQKSVQETVYSTCGDSLAAKSSPTSQSMQACVPKPTLSGTRKAAAGVG